MMHDYRTFGEVKQAFLPQVYGYVNIKVQQSSGGSSALICSIVLKWPSSFLDC